MRDIQTLADPQASRTARRRGLGRVYALAAGFPLFNTLLVWGLLPSIRGSHPEVIWVFLAGFALSWVVVEGLKARALRQLSAQRLIQAVFLDALVLLVGLLLAVFGHKLSLGWAGLFVLLGLGSYGLGFLRLAARRP